MCIDLENIADRYVDIYRSRSAIFICFILISVLEGEANYGPVC